MTPPEIRCGRTMRALSQHAVLLASVFAPSLVFAQEVETVLDSSPDVEISVGSVEEVTVLGRYKAEGTDIVSERVEQDVPVDLIDAEFIARVGDSNVADTLRRVPGLSLIDGKFIYVRGLGERYSNAQLNGANVPSPDITRNVIPLDMFPADIVDSVAVQKGYSPDLNAAFGGGSIDIRTKRVPDQFTFKLGLKTGMNGVSDSGFYYKGGKDDKWGKDDGTRALPIEISTAIDKYRGSFSPLKILTTQGDGTFLPNIEAARAVNRRLATHLNRNIDLKTKSLKQDFEGEGVLGQRIIINDALDVGYLMLGTYSNDWRNRERIYRRYDSPATDFSDTVKTTQAVNITGSLNLGIRLTDDHEWYMKGLLLRNTEDDATSSRTCSQGQFNDCLDAESPVQGRITGMRFEQRQLEMWQFGGSHTLGDDTIQGMGFGVDFLERFLGATLNWYFTESLAKTHIPNEVRISGQESLFSPNGVVDVYRVRSSGTAADYRFSDLRDDVESSGWDLVLPITFGATEIEMSGGADFTSKLRNYKQTSLGIGSTRDAFRAVSSDRPSEVFSDRNISNKDLGFELLLGIAEFGTESYIALQTIDAYYGKIDVLLNQEWRISGGLRQEAFRQISIPIDYLEYEGSRIALTLDSDQSMEDIWLESDDFYPALFVTYIRPGFGADEFQIRVGASQTVVRPDIREMSSSTYVDPITEARVRGNPSLLVSNIQNFDVRAEWYFGSGENVTASLFYKDIADPIETVQGGATEDNILFNFVNAEDAYVYGLEAEFLKELADFSDTLGDWITAFYIAGNLTLSQSEINIKPGDGVGNITNSRRRLTQHSNWVANLQLGFDSMDGQHGATLVYNSFGERIYFAGADGLPDGYEQPFHSLDLVYTYQPTENLTLKLRVKNMLDELIEVKQGDVTTIEQNSVRQLCSMFNGSINRVNEDHAHSLVYCSTEFSVSCPRTNVLDRWARSAL